LWRGGITWLGRVLLRIRGVLVRLAHSVIGGRVGHGESCREDTDQENKRSISGVPGSNKPRDVDDIPD